jgi:type I restriction enzyme M protein
LTPQEGETIYDPATGAGGMLLSAVAYVRERGGDTLENPVFTNNDRLSTFDVVLANPPYSIKQW